MNQKGSIMT